MLAGLLSVAMLAGVVPTQTEASGFLALGDSYTIGEGVEAALRWPAQLVQRLRADGVVIGPPTVVAKTGWTTDDLSNAIDDAALTPPYALVTLMIGVNDQYQGRDADTYRSKFSALLARAIAFAGNDPRRVMVVSIPDWGVTRFAREHGRNAAEVASEVDAFNHAAHGVSVAHGVAWVDVTTASRAAGAVDGMLAPDGLHPSARQYVGWVDAILPVAQAALRAP